MAPGHGAPRRHTKRAGFAVRAAAAAVDAALVLALLAAWERALAAATLWLHPQAATLLPVDWNRLGAAVLVALYLLPEALGARTPGKGLLGLRVAAAAGAPATPRQRALRTAVKGCGVAVVLVAAALRFGWPEAGFALQRWGTLLMAWVLAGTLAALAPHRRALHDLAAGTAVFGGPAPRR